MLHNIEGGDPSSSLIPLDYLVLFSTELSCGVIYESPDEGAYEFVDHRQLRSVATCACSPHLSALWRMENTTNGSASYLVATDVADAAESYLRFIGREVRHITVNLLAPHQTTSEFASYLRSTGGFSL